MSNLDEAQMQAILLKRREQQEKASKAPQSTGVARPQAGGFQQTHGGVRPIRPNVRPIRPVPGILGKPTARPAALTTTTGVSKPDDSSSGNGSVASPVTPIGGGVKAITQTAAPVGGGGIKTLAQLKAERLEQERLAKLTQDAAEAKAAPPAAPTQVAVHAPVAPVPVASLPRAAPPAAPTQVAVHAPVAPAPVASTPQVTAPTPAPAPVPVASAPQAATVAAGMQAPAITFGTTTALPKVFAAPTPIATAPATAADPAAMDITPAVVVQPTSTVVQPVQPVQQPAVRAPARAAPVSHSSSPSIINVRPAQPVQQQQQQQQQQPPVQPQPQPTVAQVVQPHKRTSNMMEETSTLIPSTAIEPAPKRPAYAAAVTISPDQAHHSTPDFDLADFDIKFNALVAAMDSDIRRMRDRLKQAIAV